jgi:hypothetical protein
MDNLLEGWIILASILVVWKLYQTTDHLSKIKENQIGTSIQICKMRDTLKEMHEKLQDIYSTLYDLAEEDEENDD